MVSSSWQRMDWGLHGCWFKYIEPCLFLMNELTRERKGLCSYWNACSDLLWRRGASSWSGSKPLCPSIMSPPYLYPFSSTFVWLFPVGTPAWLIDYGEQRRGLGQQSTLDDAYVLAFYYPLHAERGIRPILKKKKKKGRQKKDKKSFSNICVDPSALRLWPSGAVVEV